tara:strand:+ start:507 stop:689 length:183 start_codon:yes stop_codon:yes gene_type:complete
MVLSVAVSACGSAYSSSSWCQSIAALGVYSRHSTGKSDGNRVKPVTPESAVEMSSVIRLR